MTYRLLIFGLGYVGQAVAAAARAAGWTVAGTVRELSGDDGPIPFGAADDAVHGATHVLITTAPEASGDPVLARYRAAIAAAPNLKWVGYLSTTGVYGDRGGEWVCEGDAPRPGNERSRRRLDAERQWQNVANGRVALDLFRLAGIYGPGRSPLDDILAGHARRIVKHGHVFNRIHRDDIVRAVMAAMRQPREPGPRVLHLADAEPVEQATVVEEAARLLDIPPPRPIPFERAILTMSSMARSFWEENRRVSSGATLRQLELAWRYPSYREGLRATVRNHISQEG